MSSPRVTVLPMGHGRSDKLDTNPAWLVYFVRFAEPTTSNVDRKDILKEDKAIIVVNDCVNVSVSNSKNNFGKTATLTMKEGEIFYPYAVAPGDWCFIWMCDSRDDVDKVFRWLQDSKKNPKRRPNGYNSGLKFAGRVSSLGNVDITSSGGVRTVTQPIQCQSFLEMASTVYFTTFARDIIGQQIGADTATQKVQAKNAGTEEAKNTFSSLKDNAILWADRILQKAIGSNDFKKFNRFFGEFQVFGRTPDQVLSYIFTSLMGLDPVAFKAVEGFKSQPTFSTAIQIPKSVVDIFGTKGPKKNLLWQSYNILLGVQKYNTPTDKNAPWKSFFPTIRPTFTLTDKNGVAVKGDNQKDIKVGGSFGLSGGTPVFYQSAISLEGRIPYFPPLWDNKSVWDFMRQNLNELVNEMYTCLRPGPDGHIVPTLVIREKPFSTGLYNWLSTEMDKSDIKRNIVSDSRLKNGESSEIKPQQTISKSDQALSDSITEAESAKKSINNTKTETAVRVRPPDRTAAKAKGRTNFFNVPRWVVPGEMVTSVNVRQSEQRRINMTMVIPNNRHAYIGDSQTQEALVTRTYTDGSFCIDPDDIARHGLRSDIHSSNFDYQNADGTTVAVVWSRMRADWMFNGHLKLEGSVNLKGVQLPITEGDNLEVGDIVYHIEAVSHSAQINPDGTKTFNTVCQVSNGLLKMGDHWNQKPNYYSYRRNENGAVGKRSTARYGDTPGITDSQQTEHRNRNIKGEKK